VKDFGGPDTPAIGFSIGMERLLLAAGDRAAPPPPKPDVCVVSLEDGSALEAQALARGLRGQFDEPATRRALRVIVDTAGRSANAQMKWASKLGASWAVFVPMGAEGYAVRDMVKGSDEPRQRSVQELRSWLLGRRDLVGSPR
jgi:histidyl-tRNA synthetase